MSFIASMKEGFRRMDMANLADLCLLGLLYSKSQNVRDLAQNISELEEIKWQPTMDVIDATLTRLLEEKSLIDLSSTSNTYYALTALGKKKLFDLMCRPLPVDKQIRDDMLALKSTFVEELPAHVRCSVVRELIGFYNCQLVGLEEKCENCPLYSSRTQIQNRSKMAQIQHELDWLGELTAQMSHP